MEIVTLEKDDENWYHDDEVLPERLPVGEYKRIAKASAVAHRIINGQNKGEDSKKRHEQHYQPGIEPHFYIEQQAKTQSKLQGI